MRAKEMARGTPLGEGSKGHAMMRVKRAESRQSLDLVLTLRMLPSRVEKSNQTWWIRRTPAEASSDQHFLGSTEHGQGRGLSNLLMGLFDRVSNIRHTLENLIYLGQV